MQLIKIWLQDNAAGSLQVSRSLAKLIPEPRGLVWRYLDNRMSDETRKNGSCWKWHQAEESGNLIRQCKSHSDNWEVTMSITNTNLIKIQKSLWAHLKEIANEMKWKKKNGKKETIVLIQARFLFPVNPYPRTSIEMERQGSTEKHQKEAQKRRRIMK